MQFSQVLEAFLVAVFGISLVFVLLLILSVYLRAQSFLVNKVQFKNNKKNETNSKPNLNKPKSITNNQSDLSQQNFSNKHELGVSVDYDFKIDDKKYFVKIQKIED